jgi:DNA ligase-1
MKFHELAHYIETLEKTSSTNEMVLVLSELFGRLNPNEGREAVFLLLGRLGPLYQTVQFGISEKLMLRSIVTAYEQDEQHVQKKFKELGDLGDVAAFYGKHTRENDKTISEIYQQLWEIAQISGDGAVSKKVEQSADLLKQLHSVEAKYACRIILERLRAGFGDATIMDALSWSKSGDKKLRPLIEDAFNILPDIGSIAEIFLEEGIQGLEKVQITPGIPIRPAKSERLPTPEKILEKIGTCIIEPKMDGFRAQVHVWQERDQKKVKIYSRNLNETTDMFPEIVQSVQKLPIKSAIFDTEAIAYNPETEEYLPFQETVKRKRKYGIEEMSEQVPLRAFVFDLLYLNGKSLLKTAAVERFAQLQEITFESDSALCLTRHDVVSTPEEFRQLFDQYVSEGLEGVMCKKLDAIYQAGARNFNWVKYKRATEKELTDTIDTVVMGYYLGQGQRTQFGIGAFLVGLYDEESGQVKTVAKVGTGLKDDEWVALRNQADRFKSSEKPAIYDVHKNLIPDVWIKPEIVIEIGADEITRSPVHTAGRELLNNEVGLALRFPRYKKVRTDKQALDATTTEELFSLYQDQKAA